MMRYAVIILGMHRSGTSALTKVVNLLGADLPNNLMVAGEGNENGHWESQVIANFNDEILFSAGSRWNDWLPLTSSWERSAAYQDFFERACKLIQSEYGRSPLFVLKDPRMCRLAPFWLAVLEHLNIRPAIILPQRNPLEVSASLSARDGSETGLGLLLWLRHVLEAEVATRNTARCFMNFAQLLNDWTKVVSIIEQNTHVTFPRRSVLAESEIAKFLLKDAKHENFSHEEALSTAMPIWVRDVFAIMLRWSEAGENQEDYGRLDEILLAFNAASPSFAQLLTKGVGLGHGHGSESIARRELTDIRSHVAELEDRLSKTRLEADSSVETAHALALEKDEKQREAELLFSQLDTLDRACQDKQRETDQAQAALVETLALLEGERNAGTQAVAEREEKQREVDQLHSALDAIKADLEREREVAAAQAAEQKHEIEKQFGDQLSALDSAYQDKQREADQANTAMEAIRADLEHEREAAATQAAEHEKQKREIEKQFADRLNALDSVYQDKQREADEANAALEAIRADLEREREAAAIQAIVQEDQKREIEKQFGDRLSALDKTCKDTQHEADQANAAMQAIRADLERQYELALQQEESQRRLEQQLRGRISMFESALIQRQEEAAQAWAEVDAHRLHEAQLQSAVSDEQRKVVYLEQQKRDLEAGVDKYLNDIIESKEEIYGLKLLLNEKNNDVSIISHKMSVLEAIIKANAQERGAAESQIERLNIIIDMKSNIIDNVNHKIQQIISDRNQDNGALSQLKRDNEILLEKLNRTEMDVEHQRHLVESSNDRTEWLRKVSLKLKHRPMWWIFLPAKQRQKRERRMVEKDGLFNGAAYLARFPDVLESGMDPLVHYMRHGINENRSW
ncbi:hypothetical protein [Sphingobium sp. DN12]|uniref:sulfotransferase family protein n=1 Tax=Sphingobium sp. DN12 TaxID=3378073 RepID=UPI003DA6ACFA